MRSALPSGDLENAVQQYFDLLQSCDLDSFDRLFHPACHLFTVVDGIEQVLPVAAYREVIAQREPPERLGLRRDDAVLAVLSLSDDIAMVRVRVRIGPKLFQDHLSFVRSGGEWRLAAKLYALEATDAPLP